MNKIYALITFFILITFLACSESAEVEDSLLIRVKNTSKRDYINVGIDPELTGQTNNMGTLLAGEVSEYKGFKKGYEYFNVTVQITANRSVGSAVLVNDGLNALAPGKYTVEVFVPIDQTNKITIKTVKD